MTSSGNFIDRGRARVPAVLRYRGMEAEALWTTRLINVEQLVTGVRLVLDDLRSTLGEQPDFPDIMIDGAVRSFLHQADGQHPESFALGHALLVETVFETALSHIRVATDAARERLRERVWEGDGRDASNHAGTAFDTHRKPWSVNDVRGHDCRASRFGSGAGG